MAVKSEEKAQQKEREFREILDGLADVEWYHKAGEKDMDADKKVSKINVSDNGTTKQARRTWMQRRIWSNF